MKIENYKQVENLMAKRYAILETLSYAKDGFKLSIYMCKPNVGKREVFLPAEFSEVTKRVIVSHYETQLKDIEKQLLEL